MEGVREATAITETVALTGEPAPEVPQSLFASPSVPPSDETCPRTGMLSMLAVGQIDDRGEALMP